MIRPEAKESFWRWRELILSIIIKAFSRKYYIKSYGRLKISSAVAIILGAIAIYTGQQKATSA